MDAETRQRGVRILTRRLHEQLEVLPICEVEDCPALQEQWDRLTLSQKEGLARRMKADVYAELGICDGC